MSISCTRPPLVSALQLLACPMHMHINRASQNMIYLLPPGKRESISKSKARRETSAGPCVLFRDRLALGFLLSKDELDVALFISSRRIIVVFVPFYPLSLSLSPGSFKDRLPWFPFARAHNSQCSVFQYKKPTWREEQRSNAMRTVPESNLG